MSSTDKNAYQVIEGDFASAQGNYAVLATHWNSFVVENLKEGTLQTLQRHGISNDAITVCYVPGAFELPLVAKKLAASGKYQAVIALGAVIRGGTPHFEYVAGECARGLSRAALETGVPIIFGVLTVDNIDQANERSGKDSGNKGVEAATTAMEMVSLLRQL